MVQPRAGLRSRSQPLSGKQHWAGCWEQEPVSSVSQPAPHLRVKASLRGSPHPPRHTAVRREWDGACDSARLQVMIAS